MTSNKNVVLVTLSLVGAAAILVTAWVANGSEREDSWLYVTAIWLVLYAGVDAYMQWKKNKSQK